MNTKKHRVGSEVQYGPRLAGEVLHDYLENSNDALATAYRGLTAETAGWNNDTNLGVNLKTQLRSDRRAKDGKLYRGVLKRDTVCEEFLYDDHFTFTETVPTTCKRNPRVFEGEYLTVTRRDDGLYRLNFKPLRMEPDFCLERYARRVYDEILMALRGLVEE